MSDIEYFCNICVDVNLLRCDSSYVYVQYYYMFLVGSSAVGCLNASMMLDDMENIVDQTRLVKVIVLFFVFCATA